MGGEHLRAQHKVGVGREQQGTTGQLVAKLGRQQVAQRPHEYSRSRHNLPVDQLQLAAPGLPVAELFDVGDGERGHGVGLVEGVEQPLEVRDA